jgi:hypothetical protein
MTRPWEATGRTDRRCLWALAFACACLLLIPALGHTADNQSQAAQESMQPLGKPPPPVRNKITPPAWAAERWPADWKAALQALSEAPPPAPTTPETPSTTAAPSPTTPPTEPGQPPKPADTPTAPKEDNKVRIRADRLLYNQGVTMAEGNVELKYQDITISGQAADLDKDQRFATVRGRVDMAGPSFKVQAEDLRIDLDSEAWSLEDGRVTVEPEFFATGVKAPLYLRGNRMLGRPGRVVALGATGTSCDNWDNPHYALRSDEITVIPGKRITFHRPTLYLFGHRLFRYPFNLSLALDRRENRFLPEVGQNTVEGYFAKFSFGYVLNAANTGFLRLNVTSKRGTGFGLDHSLEQPHQTGELSLFFEPAMDSYSGHLTHHVQLSDPFSTDTTFDVQRESGFGLGTESLNGTMSFHYNDRDSQSLLGLQESLMTSSFSSSRTFAANFTHRQRMGTTGDWSVRDTYRRSAFTVGQVPDEELESEFTWRRQWAPYDLQILAQRRYDLDGSTYTGDDNFYALYRLPELVFTTESARLGDRRLLGRSAFRSTITLGSYVQLPDNLRLSRAALNLELPGHLAEYGDGSSSLRTAARFRQNFYSDGSAQWVGDFHTEYYRKLTRTWDSRLTFDYSKPSGFAPLRLDAASPTSIARFQAVRLLADRMRLDFSVGRDLYYNYYHDALLRSEVPPDPAQPPRTAGRLQHPAGSMAAAQPPLDPRPAVEHLVGAHLQLRPAEHAAHERELGSGLEPHREMARGDAERV